MDWSITLRLKRLQTEDWPASILDAHSSSERILSILLCLLLLVPAGLVARQTTGSYQEHGTMVTVCIAALLAGDECRAQPSSSHCS